MLCPLLVTANNFLLGDTAIFKGKSPNGKLFPTGLRLQPLGNTILDFEMDLASCAKRFIEHAMNSKV
jgi:hypothetical protein